MTMSTKAAVQANSHHVAAGSVGRLIVFAGVSAAARWPSHALKPARPMSNHAKPAAKVLMLDKPSAGTAAAKKAVLKNCGFIKIINSI